MIWISFVLVLYGIIISLLIWAMIKAGAFSVYKEDKSTFRSKSQFHGTAGPRSYGIATNYRG